MTANGPYIITTKERRAVATLEEARQHCRHIINGQPYGPLPQSYSRLLAEVVRISESGGSISLPDGTVIEVENVTDQQLTDQLPDHMRRNLWRRHPSVMPRQALCDAYNARQEADRAR